MHIERGARLPAVVLVAFSLALGACGGDDKDAVGVLAGNGGITKAAFYECVENTDLKLSKTAGPVPGGNGDIRANFELDGMEYAGFVVWPSGSVVDVWIGPDEDAAGTARDQYLAVWKGFGKGDEGDKLVQQKANVVVGLDDEKPPSLDEAETLDGCLSA